MEKSVESSLPSATESQINSSVGSILSSSEGNDGSKKWKLFNIVMLGITFMSLFTAFQTCAMVQVGLVIFKDWFYLWYQVFLIYTLCIMQTTTYSRLLFLKEPTTKPTTHQEMVTPGEYIKYVDFGLYIIC